MGIQGLMSFILQHSNIFLEDIELHDTYLIIDGDCISIRIYLTNKCYSCFGGNYDKFTFYVHQFFDELQKCNITPIVFCDGGSQDKKFNTIYKRRQEAVRRLVNSNPNRNTEIPLLLTVVFKNILRKRNIICIQSVFEADNDISLTAKILNSPVLSFDSDFFLFDVLCIPHNTFKKGIYRNVTGTGYFKLCQVFKPDYLVKNYPGLNKKVLLLSAALLGNDFVNPIIFKKFFSTLSLPKTLKESVTYDPHLKKEALFRWLQNHNSLDSAITAILYTIDTDKQQKVIETIEMIINEYLQINVSSVMLEPLGFSQEEIDTFVNKFHHKKYKFEKLDNWKIEENLTHDECYLTCDENDLMNSLSLEDEEELFYCPSRSRNVIDIIPPWFLKKYHTGAFPSYFIDILHNQCIFVLEQVENVSYPASFNISLKIVSVIFRLLTTGLNVYSKTLKYITRGNGITLETCELDCNKFKYNFSIPSLEELEDYPAVKKKQIFLETMGVSEELLVKFPPKWRQFIASIKFWLNEADKMFRTKYHLYAVIFNIIWHVIKEMKNSNFVNMNEVNETKEDVCSIIVEDMSIKDALEKVNIHDCIKSERFFKSHILYVNKRQFEITIVHAFALLQNCIRSCIHLNGLLGDPYPQLDVAEFFNGVLVYNIFNEIRLDKQLNQRVCTIFKNSPSILQLFVSISKQILSAE